MFCENCGKESNKTQKFCINCGTSFSSNVNGKEKEVLGKYIPPLFLKEKGLNVGRIITVLIVVVFIGFGIYNSLDDKAIEINDKALSSVDVGDSEGAVGQLKQALEEAFTDDVKIDLLKNLAYVYEGDALYDQAHDAYSEALTYTDKGSFDYYLISGDLATIEGKFNAAKLSYDKAYQLNPDDFQINTSLSLFYLDLEDLAPYYVDYPKALMHAQKAYDKSPEKSEIAKLNLAITHYFNENYDATISLLSSTNLNQHPYAAYWLGWAYTLKMDASNAEWYFQKAIDGGIEVEQEAYDYLYQY